MKYLNTVVDRVEILFQEFFKDNKTTYIFTADHGMTDWGSHGSGSAFETHVPVVAWGAGVSKGRKRNIKQNDLAPLISSLIGINIPTNSLVCFCLLVLGNFVFFKFFYVFRVVCRVNT